MAIGLVSLVLLGIVELLVVVSRSGKDTQMTSQAMYAAQEKLDDILRLNIKVSTHPTVDVPASMPIATRTVVGSSDPLGNSAVQIVTVTVTWNEEGRTRSISLRSAVST